MAIIFGVGLLATRHAPKRPLALMLLLGVLILGAFLMETALLTLVLLVLGWVLEKEVSTNQRKSATVFLLSALVPLCRLDAIIIPWIWAASAVKARWARFMVGGSLIGAVLQLSSMKLLFGHWLSVSSSLKLGRALEGVGVIAGNSLQVGTTFRLVLGVALAVLAALSLPDQPAKLRRIYMGALLGVACFTLGHVLFSEIRSWYFLPLYGVASWVSSSSPKLPTAGSVKWRSLAMRVIILLTVGASLWKGYQFAAKSVRSEKAWAFVAKVEQLVPPGELIFEIDASGFPGFWSRRDIVNGDGLVNSYGYARRLTNDQLSGYLEEQGICYVMTTGRVVSRVPGQLLDFHGLRLQTSSVEPVYPSTSVLKSGTQLLKRVDRECQ